MAVSESVVFYRVVYTPATVTNANLTIAIAAIVGVTAVQQQSVSEP